MFAMLPYTDIRQCNVSYYTIRQCHRVCEARYKVWNLVAYRRRTKYCVAIVSVTQAWPRYSKASQLPPRREVWWTILASSMARSKSASALLEFVGLLLKSQSIGQNVDALLRSRIPTAQRKAQYNKRAPLRSSRRGPFLYSFQLFCLQTRIIRCTFYIIL